MNDISEEKETPKLFDFQLKSSKFGIDVRIPCIKLSDNHPCKGCMWYDRNTDVLFCPFHSCVRYRKGFMPKKRWMKMLIKRGDIFYADLNPVVGSEQGVFVLCWWYRIMWETGTAQRSWFFRFRRQKSIIFPLIFISEVQKHCPRIQSCLRNRYGR